MATEYKIYLKNSSADTLNFWFFLAAPIMSPKQDVFANSSTVLQVPPNDPNTNTFVVPVQYKVGAGASNNAVGLNTKVASQGYKEAALKNQFTADYATVPPPAGPKLALSGTAAGSTEITIGSNGYNKVTNKANHWYESMSFGITTSGGFSGVTWDPSPATTYHIKPKLNFYVATGDFQSNELADITAISTEAANLIVPDSFDAINQCTVERTATGAWNVTPGGPPPVVHALGKATPFKDSITGVTWDKTVHYSSHEENWVGRPLITVSATLNLAVGLPGGFGNVNIGGITFAVSYTAGAFSCRITYSGPLGLQALMNAVHAGAIAIFG